MRHPFFGEWASDKLLRRTGPCVRQARPGKPAKGDLVIVVKSAMFLSRIGRLPTWNLPLVQVSFLNSTRYNFFFQICLCILKLTRTFYVFLICTIFWCVCVFVYVYLYVCNIYTPWNGSTELINIGFISHNYHFVVRAVSIHFPVSAWRVAGNWELESYKDSPRLLAMMLTNLGLFKSWNFHHSPLKSPKD